MLHPTLRAGVVLLLAVSSATAQYFEARNNAMGGAGVASSHSLAAGWANPALLTRVDDAAAFALLLPTLGVQLNDESGLLDDINSFVDEYERLSATTPTVGEIQALGAQLAALSGRTLNANLGGGFAFAMPGKGLGWSLHAHSYTDAQGLVNVDPADLAALSGGTIPGTFGSEARILGVGVSEVGVSLAHEFSLGPTALSVGVTPKYQRVDTYNYSVNVTNFDAGDYDDSQYRNDDDAFNVDVGAAFDSGTGLVIGIMGRNLIGETYTTELILGDQFEYEINPQVALGAAYSFAGATLTADVDLVSAERFKSSPTLPTKDDVQLFHLGAEVDLLTWLQLRGGYQADFENSIDPVYSAGLGISPFNVVHIDVAGTYVDSQSYGAMLQLAFTF